MNNTFYIRSHRVPQTFGGVFWRVLAAFVTHPSRFLRKNYHVSSETLRKKDVFSEELPKSFRTTPEETPQF
ncbi:hypothetical protein AAH994_03255 [Weeksellaceae bacterium A-14]|uniref:hypothetical protein n=1 Tax=Daejeonia sp. YH14 TaxID=3439042 RepID=UPI0031E4D519